MGQLSTSSSKQRSERRIYVRLPVKVSGRDRRGIPFEEETSSENLCRSGAALFTRLDVAVGSDLEIRFPISNLMARRNETDFATRGRVVHVGTAATGDGERIIGVRFTGPRFRRVFRPETAA